MFLALKHYKSFAMVLMSQKGMTFDIWGVMVFFFFRFCEINVVVLCVWKVFRNVDDSKSLRPLRYCDTSRAHRAILVACSECLHRNSSKERLQTEKDETANIFYW